MQPCYCNEEVCGVADGSPLATSAESLMQVAWTDKPFLFLSGHSSARKLNRFAYQEDTEGI